MLHDYLYNRNIEEHKDIYFSDFGFYSEIFFQEKEEKITHYGVEVYKLICDATEECIRSGKMLDYRLFYIMYEKNINLISKVKYYCKMEHIDESIFACLIEDIEGLCKELKRALYRVLAYANSKQSKAIEGLDEIVMHLYEEEKRIYASIYQMI